MFICFNLVATLEMLDGEKIKIYIHVDVVS